MPRKIPDQLTKIMMNEAENPWQEIIDWLYYDYNKASEGARLEILADIRYLEWLGDGNNTVGIKLKYGKIATNKTSLLRRVLEAEEAFALIYNKGKCYSYLVLFEGFDEDYNVGYRCHSPCNLVENIREYARNNDRVLRSKKRYRDNNKDKAKIYNKRYREEHKEEIKKQYKVQRDNNRDRMNAYRREYYQKNKEKINARKRNLRRIKKEE